ncbi:MULTISPECIES: hypothetical protein [Lysinibacillus]|nr:MULTISPECIES: hypothetical protein [Lysinibacillus]
MKLVKRQTRIAEDKIKTIEVREWEAANYQSHQLIEGFDSIL